MELLTAKPIRRPIRTHLLLSLAVLLSAAGCASSRSFTPDMDPNTLDGTSFLHYLSPLPAVTVEEACRAIILIADGKENLQTFEARYQELLDRGVIRSAWNLEADHLLDKATLAYMAVKVCHVEPGFNSLLLGSWGLGDRHYALQDAVAAGLMLYDADFKAVRGGELVGVLARMDDLMAKKGLYAGTAQDVDSPEDLDQSAPP
ncbi:MAG: hypothetical protein ACE5GE_11105 [Phycisphaerae bacterium]